MMIKTAILEIRTIGIIINETIMLTMIIIITLSTAMTIAITEIRIKTQLKKKNQP